MFRLLYYSTYRTPLQLTTTLSALRSNPSKLLSLGQSGPSYISSGALELQPYNHCQLRCLLEGTSQGRTLYCSPLPLRRRVTGAWGWWGWGGGLHSRGPVTHHLTQATVQRSTPPPSTESSPSSLQGGEERGAKGGALRGSYPGYQEASPCTAGGQENSLLGHSRSRYSAHSRGPIKDREVVLASTDPVREGWMPSLACTPPAGHSGISNKGTGSFPQS